MNTKQAITDLLVLAIRSERTRSRKMRQISKMRAGKIRRVLDEANQASKKLKSGIKISN